MPEAPENTTFIDDKGNFTDDFRTKLPEFLGEEHKNFKGFDDIGSLQSLVKVHADTKSALGRKQDNVIQKPGENASEEERQAYQQAVRQANGVPATAEEYTINTEGVPDGIDINEHNMAAWKTAFHKAGVGADGANILFEQYKQVRAAEMQAHQQAMETQYKAESAKLKEHWPGDAMLEMPRIAYNALNAFCDAEVKENLRKAGVWSDPSNLDKWRAAGITPMQLSLWGSIGKRMKMGTILQDNSGGMSPADTRRGQLQRQYPNSPELWGPEE